MAQSGRDVAVDEGVRRMAAVESVANGGRSRAEPPFVGECLIVRSGLAILHSNGISSLRDPALRKSAINDE